MSQSELASQLKVSASTVSKWETGKNFPDIPTFHNLAALFNISFDDLHNPQNTLKRLSEENELPLEDSDILRQEEPFAEKKSFQNHNVRVILTSVFILFCIFLFTRLIKHSNANS